MIESSLARSGYENSAQSTGSDRGIEYQLFARVTRELSNVNKDAPDHHSKFQEALHTNLRLWLIIAGDVAHENNALPAELRSKLFYLADFTRHHTAKVQAGEANTDVLVEINMAVMRGLRASKDAKSEVS